VTTPLPDGFRIEVDARQVDATTLFGGAPARFLRLSPAGATAWRELRDGPVASRAAGILARKLTDAGLAHPRPPAVHPPEVTVIIPVRDRTDMLADCLAAVGDHRVIVVDDGSRDPKAVADVVAKHGAKLVARTENGGPAAARNDGLAHASSGIVAFLDSDCVAPPGWITTLAGHFVDPLVAAVAPRVVPVPETPWAGGLDLGDRPARVVPGTRVAYVPTAALLVRRDALADMLFDTDLRHGEDVDLVWRLHERGWRIRYDPSVHVRHREPATWQGLLARRFRYGTSAGPLSRRHPAAMAPLALLPWHALTVAALLAGSPLAALTFTAAVDDTARKLAAAHVPESEALTATVTSIRQTWLGASRYGTQFAAPLLLAALLVPGKPRRAAAALLLSRPVAAYLARRPAMNPIRFALGSIADDIAYGAGVWTGCVRARTTTPVRPIVP
jgi:mycofactocin system glycosyltransferase